MKKLLLLAFFCLSACSHHQDTKRFPTAQQGVHCMSQTAGAKRYFTNDEDWKTARDNVIENCREANDGDLMCKVQWACSRTIKPEEEQFRCSDGSSVGVGIDAGEAKSATVFACMQENSSMKCRSRPIRCEKAE